MIIIHKFMEKTVREREFPQDLESRLGNILNVVNTEFKSITLLHLDDNAADGMTIRERIIRNYPMGYLPHYGAFLDYCKFSFLPIGSVAEERIRRDDGSIYVGYTLNESGRKYGLPIAAFSLNWAVENQFSFFNLLGATSSPGKDRSPLARMKILEALYTGESYSLEISKFIKDNPSSSSVIFRHIKSLKELGLIEISKGNNTSNKNRKFYSLSNSGKEIVKNYLFKIKEALSDNNSLQELNEFYYNLVGDQNKFSKLIKEAMKLYSDVSPRLNSKPRSDVDQTILELISLNPGITPTQIEGIIGISRIQNHLTPLLKSGKVRKERKSYREVKYYLAN